MVKKLRRIARSVQLAETNEEQVKKITAGVLQELSSILALPKAFWTGKNASDVIADMKHVLAEDKTLNITPLSRVLEDKLYRAINRSEQKPPEKLSNEERNGMLSDYQRVHSLLGELHSCTRDVLRFSTDIGSTLYKK